MTAAACAARPHISVAELPKSPFRISVINDEISQDFDHDCYIASRDFGMSWIELRSMWGKNVMELSAAEIDEARKILDEIQPAGDRHRQSRYSRPTGRARRGRNMVPRVTCTARPRPRSRSRMRFWSGPSLWPSSSIPARSAASTSGGWTMLLRTARRSTRSCARPPRPPASKASCWCWRTSLRATPPPAARPRGH